MMFQFFHSTAYCRLLNIQRCRSTTKAAALSRSKCVTKQAWVENYVNQTYLVVLICFLPSTTSSDEQPE
jgi:hypothetical protein